MSSVFNVRWPDTNLESRLKALAVANKRSLQAEVLVALERYAGLAVPAVVGGHVGQGDPVSASEADDVKQPPVASYSERFVVPASCPAPNTKKSFKPDFK